MSISGVFIVRPVATTLLLGAHWGDPLAVAALTGVREVALYGRGLHVVAADAAALIPALTLARRARTFAGRLNNLMKPAASL